MPVGLQNRWLRMTHGELFPGLEFVRRTTSEHSSQHRVSERRRSSVIRAPIGLYFAELSCCAVSQLSRCDSGTVGLSAVEMGRGDTRAATRSNRPGYQRSENFVVCTQSRAEEIALEWESPSSGCRLGADLKLVFHQVEKGFYSEPGFDFLKPQRTAHLPQKGLLIGCLI
jgi:hypothetical protein